MPDYSPDQIARLLKDHARLVMADAARRADVHPGAEQDFVPEIAKAFEFDAVENVLKLKATAPAGTTVNSIIDAARKTAPHRFRDIAPVESNPTTAGKTFGGFSPDAKAADDFFATSPEDKIRIANEMTRPKGW